MRRGYIRLDKSGPSQELQEAALRTAGITDFGLHGPVFLDDAKPGRVKLGAEPLPERARAIRALREGDELVVMSAGRLGLTTEDTLQAMAKIGERGAVLFEVESGRAYTWHPQAAEMAALAARSESQRRREKLKVMRVAAAELGVERGWAAKLSAKKLKEARADWSSVALTADEVGKKYGVPTRTLYRMFGPRGTPRFGGLKARRMT